jgi:hypothetical protein
MRAVARPDRRAYLALMASAILRLLALIALALMPLSMASAPAAAQPVAAAPSGHCDNHRKPADAPATSQMHCTACAALPAMAAPAQVAELAPETPMVIARVGLLAGIEPETATPPPKIV